MLFGKSKKRNYNYKAVELKEINEHREHFNECYPTIPVKLFKGMGAVGTKMLAVLDVAAEDQRHSGDTKIAARFYKHAERNSANTMFYMFPELTLSNMPQKVQDYVHAGAEFDKKYGVPHVSYTEYITKLIDAGWDTLKGILLIFSYMDVYMCSSEKGTNNESFYSPTDSPRQTMIAYALSYLTYYEHPDYDKRNALSDEIESFLQELALEGIDYIESLDKNRIMDFYKEACKICKDGEYDDEKAAKRYIYTNICLPFTEHILTDTRVSDILSKYVSPISYYCMLDIIDFSKDFEPEDMWFTSRPELFLERFKQRAYKKEVDQMLAAHEKWLEKVGIDGWKKKVENI